MCSREPRARYIVGIPKTSILYEGDSRFLAWCHWLINFRTAIAFDRRSWISDSSYWLIDDKLNEKSFEKSEVNAPQGALIQTTFSNLQIHS